jgi:hypothetical protein
MPGVISGQEKVSALHYPAYGPARAELDRALELCGPDGYSDWAMIRLDRAACMARDGDHETGLGYASETLLALEAPKRQGVINGHGRELLAALTPAQRSSQAARDFRVLLEQPPT